MWPKSANKDGRSRFGQSRHQPSVDGTLAPAEPVVDDDGEERRAGEFQWGRRRGTGDSWSRFFGTCGANDGSCQSCMRET